jgi:ABC-type polysaccharide/polyol phosphate export permease
LSTEIEQGAEQPDAATNVVTKPGAEPSPERQRESEFNPELHVYEPHVVGLPPLRPYLRELWKRREFAKELSRSKLRGQHFNTAFGQLWLVLNPLLLALVYFILVDIIRGGNRPPGFFAHLTAGIFAYYFISGSVREATRSVVSGGRLILNTAFPRVLLPLSTVFTAFLRFLPTVIIYIPIHVAHDLPFTWQMLWVVPIFACFTLIAAGVGMLVAALQVYFRDVKNFMPYVLRIWLYASPVLYFASEVPQRYEWVLKFNPLGGLLTAWDDAIHFGRAPAASDMLLGLTWGLILFFAGAIFFMSRERDFAVRL